MQVKHRQRTEELERKGGSYLRHQIFFVAAVMILLCGFNSWLWFSPGMKPLDEVVIKPERKSNDDAKRSILESMQALDELISEREKDEDEKRREQRRRAQKREEQQLEYRMIAVPPEVMARMEKEIQEARKRIVEHVKLGRPEAPKRVTLSWINWNDFQRLIARKKPYDQPGTQTKAPSTTGAIRMDPGEPTGDLEEVHFAGDNVNKLKAISEPDAKEGQLEKAAIAAENKSAGNDGQIETAEVPEVQKAPGTEGVLVSVGDQSSKGVEFAAEKAPDGAKRERQAGEYETVGASLQINARSNQKGADLKAIEQYGRRRSYDLTSEKTFEPITSEFTVPKSKAEKTAMRPLAQSSEEGLTPEKKKAPAKEMTKEEEVLQDLDQYVVALMERKRLQGKGPTVASLADSESVPVSRISLGKHQLGGVLVSKGLEVKTFMPRLDPVMQLTTPYDPVVAILFDENGKVHYARFVKGTRQPSWDAPILNSVYRFVARGPQLKPGHFVQVVIEFDLGP